MPTTLPPLSAAYEGSRWCSPADTAAPGRPAAGPGSLRPAWRSRPAGRAGTFGHRL